MTGRLSSEEITVLRQLIDLHKKQMQAAEAQDILEFERLKEEFKRLVPAATEAVLDALGKYLVVTMRRCARKRRGR